MNSAAAKFAAWSITLVLVHACIPPLEDDPSLALDGQILAIQFEPAEAKPESSIHVNALVASEAEDLTDQVSFSLCLARKPLSELGPVHPACLASANDDDAVQPLGEGASVQLIVPKNACSLFGPQRPPAEPGQPPGRAVDPDATGGFYQPVIARLNDSALGSLRLDCGLPGGAQAQVAQYNQEHVPNRNPTPSKVELRVERGKWQTVTLGEAGPIQVPRNRVLSLRTSWTAGEKYLFLSPDSRELTYKTETLVASFYSSVGAFDEHRVEVDQSGRVGSKLRTPTQAGEVRVWVVVRDGRGGAGWASITLEVD